MRFAGCCALWRGLGDLECGVVGRQAGDRAKAEGVGGYLMDFIGQVRGLVCKGQGSPPFPSQIDLSARRSRVFPVPRGRPVGVEQGAF